MNHYTNGNGGAAGATNGAPVEMATELGEITALLEPRPDLHRALEEAIEISARRGTALAGVVSANTVKPNGANPGVAASDGAKNGAKKSPKEAEFATPVPHRENMPPAALEGIRSVDIMQSLAPLAPRMKSVEREIERMITTPVKLVADIAGHVLGAGGKRLRPALALLAAQICGDDGDNPAPRAVTCACLVELTHTTTLLHDDVVDGATTRRGKPAANLVWGNETSVLVGDYLFAQVFVTASRRGIAELMHPLAHATAQMCAGELLETQMRGFWEMSDTQYLEIVALKTGSLTECATRMGALAVNATEQEVDALGNFGRFIGIAFQIVDDVFDVTSTSEEIGKPVGNDLREGAITLPMLWTLKHSPDADELRDILASEEKDDAQVMRALEIMRAGDAIMRSLKLARDYTDKAKAQLDIFPDSEAKSMLNDIADYVLSREK